ncbi:MAG: MFS transporter [Candidatus Eisenbacteria bacterium]|nr:MFS transporter [Candidatus Eisenbacteria bacterium]
MNEPQFQVEESIYRRIFLLGVLNGIFFNVSGVFLSASTVVPLFVSHLTDSKVLIGLAGSIENIGWYLPQIVVAGLTLHHSRQLRIYKNAAYFRIVAFSLLVLSAFILPQRSPTLCLVLFLSMLTLYALSGGMAGIAFMDIVGRTVPPNRRGSFFGMRMTIGGAFGILAGFAVNSLLAGYDYPLNFGIIFLVGFLFMGLGLFSFFFITEPELKSPRPKRTLAANVKEAYSFFRSDKDYKTLFWVRTAISSFFLGYPFYIIFAEQVLRYPPGSAGIFVSYEMAGYLVSNILWAYLSDRVSNPLVMLLSAVSAALAPCFVLISFAVKLPLQVFAMSFFLLGATASGLWVGFMNYLLEIAPDDHRPLYLGFLNTLIALTLFLPLLGGSILEISSYQFLFSLIFGLGLLSVFLAYRLYRSKTVVARSKSLT